MERKRFLATAAGVGAVLAAASAAIAAPPPVTTPTSSPGSHTWQRGEFRSNRNIRVIRKHLERVIDELQHDQHDYGGHRVKALDLLNQARQELLLAEQAGTAH